ncbi:hypothetical protein FKG96_12600 [Olivibacter sp. LS-1]|uniref:hypothetical protein n=1 Tax=unclassified Olivibacter TaxID=2632301 RepID=UPI0011EAADBA|nr:MULTISPECIES: hypothetical protein [unclassified Olivibacter]MDM8174825.1 hypothetical protein [Olivibacter sp. 47]QEL01612.1 hypothetical protein FKG96_12600 [Olivibacter sp. LS-1]
MSDLVYSDNNGVINIAPLPKKTYVLTTSKVFMKGHQRAGEPTGFRDKILSGEKIHTIRAGEHWKKVVEEVNKGIAILSVREWTGKPYASKQDEYARFEKLGWQSFEISSYGTIYIDGEYANPSYMGLIPSNDGLTTQDFISWFKTGTVEFSGGIIHFTDFRY